MDLFLWRLEILYIGSIAHANTGTSIETIDQLSKKSKRQEMKEKLEKDK